MNKAAAKTKLERLMEIEVEIKVKKEEAGIDQLEQEKEEIRRDVTHFMAVKNVGRIELPGGSYGGLVRPTSGQWDTRKLRKLVPANLFKAMTMRVVNPQAIQELIDAGSVKEEKIANAYIVYEKAPYLRIYKGEADADEA